MGIEQVTQITALGVVINDHVTATDHVTALLTSCSKLLYALRFSMRPQHGLAFARLVIETDLTRFYADVLSWVIETSPRHLLKISLVTAMNSYSQELTPTAFIYSTSTCLIILLLAILSDRGDTIKHS